MSKKYNKNQHENKTHIFFVIVVLRKGKKHCECGKTEK